MLYPASTEICSVSKHYPANLALRPGRDDLIVNRHVAIHFLRYGRSEPAVNFTQQDLHLHERQAVLRSVLHVLHDKNTYFLPMQPLPPEENVKKSRLRSKSPSFSSQRSGKNVSASG